MTSAHAAVVSDRTTAADVKGTCPQKLDRFEVENVASWTCPRKLDRFEVEDFASYGPGQVPRGHELPRGNLPQGAVRPDLIVVPLPLQ